MSTHVVFTSNNENITDVILSDSEKDCLASRDYAEAFLQMGSPFHTIFNPKSRATRKRLKALAFGIKEKAICFLAKGYTCQISPCNDKAEPVKLHPTFPTFRANCLVIDEPHRNDNRTLCVNFLCDGFPSDFMAFSKFACMVADAMRKECYEAWANAYELNTPVRWLNAVRVRIENIEGMREASQRMMIGNRLPSVEFFNRSHAPYPYQSRLE